MSNQQYLLNRYGHENVQFSGTYAFLAGVASRYSMLEITPVSGYQIVILGIETVGNEYIIAHSSAALIDANITVMTAQCLLWEFETQTRRFTAQRGTVAEATFEAAVTGEATVDHVFRVNPTQVGPELMFAAPKNSTVFVSGGAVNTQFDASVHFAVVPGK